jgi:CO/xanthine dehydrogenase FAD-binding subunit
MQVLRPESLADALDLLAVPDTARVPIAGGTDLLVSWHHQPKDQTALLDLSPLREELGTLRLTDDELEIGALVTYWDILQTPDVTAAFPLLADAARQVGAVQIQTRGTWAGNIANGSPAADGVPVLMAYDARVVLADRNGREEIPLDAFYTGYRQSRRRRDQLIVGLRLPRRPCRRAWFHKVGARRAQAITKVGVAVVRDSAGWRVVANSVAPTVCRCRALEAALTDGRRFASPAELRATLDADIAPIDDIRSTARYRATVLSRLLYHWLADNA